MTLTDLYEALREIDPNVYYGTAAQHPKNAPWDYIVYNRDVLSRKQNKSGYSDDINVVIIREEAIPDGLPEQVIAAVEALPGFRLREGGHEYAYTVKPSTKLTVERLVLKFAHARKQ